MCLPYYRLREGYNRSILLLTSDMLVPFGMNLKIDAIMGTLNTFWMM